MDVLPGPVTTQHPGDRAGRGGSGIIRWKNSRTSSPPRYRRYFILTFRYGGQAWRNRLCGRKESTRCLSLWPRTCSTLGPIRRTDPWVESEPLHPAWVEWGSLGSPLPVPWTPVWTGYGVRAVSNHPASGTGAQGRSERYRPRPLSPRAGPASWVDSRALPLTQEPQHRPPVVRAPRRDKCEEGPVRIPSRSESPNRTCGSARVGGWVGL